ncbi:hypothetical protein BDZ91DRAFT_259428 [Kalaharituber pfeilii]|nr:hypothetical protein BDZ91DRAFT_259428 [Kalaharituber pfeilii]
MTNMTTQQDITQIRLQHAQVVSTHLESLNIRYCVAGSVALALQGVPRSRPSRDIDVIIFVKDGVVVRELLLSRYPQHYELNQCRLIYRHQQVGGETRSELQLLCACPNAVAWLRFGPDDPGTLDIVDDIPVLGLSRCLFSKLCATNDRLGPNGPEWRRQKGCQDKADAVQIARMMLSREMRFTVMLTDWARAAIELFDESERQLLMNIGVPVQNG